MTGTNVDFASGGVPNEAPNVASTSPALHLVVPRISHAHSQIPILICLWMRKAQASPLADTSAHVNADLPLEGV